ncbi:ATP-binding protein [Coleofasciculus sp.]|uniref:ATP-binding protein n=1 Tax=Coleofasciculus sp. TaxID=3100458 RepID=UPI003A265E6B
MKLDLRSFFQATNPGKTLFLNNAEADYKYYIDFSVVRGGQVIEELRETITLWSPDTPTCQLFTGHIGCGKSTELLRLKAELEYRGFHVVYFVSDQDLEFEDVDISDILLAIARQVSNSLDTLKLEESTSLNTRLNKVRKLLQTEIELSGEASVLGVGKITGKIEEEFSVDVGIPGIGKVSLSSEEGLSLIAPLIGKISAKAKASPELRNKLRSYLEPQTKGILEAINSELLEPGQEKLKAKGKKGLVVIVDNLDRISNTPKPFGRAQQEYLFVDRGEQLRQLNCHVIYTMPLALRFSKDFGTLVERFLVNPQVLPMIPVRSRDGKECAEGMKRLRQMVLARAFPDLNEPDRLNRITEVFDHPATLDRLCQISGGHVRNLLRLLNDSIKKQKGLPIRRDCLEEVIREHRNDAVLAVIDTEWELLRQVAQHKKVAGAQYYKTLIRSLFVYEYRDDDGYWFDINPILAEAKELKS